MSTTVGAPVSHARPADPVEYTWRDSELRSPPLRALNAVGAGPPSGWAGRYRP